ncbi:Ig-like and fibronectin type-III domain-containing protein 1 isoform X2 [Neocloeon triangulifer]|uniref:Ig-like and fibronectin type-III domain-containing protein 1 isoform X2 n=1 Tax=Neocloeon triangulifer TaxID=2078957 RepID=UPI00286ED74C|nr:Ig-like and fibronectin type-III domain-containing protein 1 isoform X2 [Neocloeon triangulifer]
MWSGVLLVLCGLLTPPGAHGANWQGSGHASQKHAVAGEDALITCLVSIADSSSEGLPANGVIWAKLKTSDGAGAKNGEDRREILTADTTRVTTDRRFSAIRSDEGDHSVLVIRNVQPSDAGIYVCEVSKEQGPARSFHELNVLELPQLHKKNNNDASTATPTEASRVARHNFTECCVQADVSKRCLGFCNLQNIVEGNTGEDVHNCEVDFPHIINCMADGRDHTACCAREGVIDLCIDVCRGIYTPTSDKIKTHYSCDEYTERALACVAEGVEILPSTPRRVRVEALSEHTLQVSWRFPEHNADSVTQYEISVQHVTSFDPPKTTTESDAVDVSALTPVPTQGPFNLQLKVPATYNSSLISSLNPFSMYEIAVIAVNRHGKSLPSPAIRTLTLVPGQKKSKSPTSGTLPPLPDVKKCCIEEHKVEPKCAERLCNPHLEELTDLSELFECAPYATAALQCLTGGQDHTACCRARGVPDPCRDFCRAGNETVTFDYSHIRCIEYSDIYSSCLLQSYGILPSAPLDIQVTNINHDFAIIHWSDPEVLPETIHHFVLHYHKLDQTAVDDLFVFRTVLNVKSPYLLSRLKPDTRYEAYVQAVNEHGTGEPSQRIVFTTLTEKMEEQLEQEEVVDIYNSTECCVSAGLSPLCLPLCSYDASIHDVRALSTVCAPYFHTLLRCGAGGRDHQACCKRRGVPSRCQSLCYGILEDSIPYTAAMCKQYVGNIIQCFEEGAGTLPGPVRELHALEVTNHSVSLTWEQPEENAGPKPTGYEVRYIEVNDSAETREPKVKSVSNTSATIEGLVPGKVYDFYVLSENEHGTSLPSAMLRINITATDVGSGLAGMTSSPRGLSIAGRGANFLTLAWQPPFVSHPSDPIKYSVHYRENLPGEQRVPWIRTNTSITSALLENLKPNTQYQTRVVAITDKGSSLPSETLLVWTDPAMPAIVEPPKIQPGAVVEGGSITVLCIALGTPAPTVSLYVSGKLAHSEKDTRHLVVTLHNITRHMRQLSCYADNGFGTPMQASKRIVVNYPPTLSASSAPSLSLKGGTGVLECKVEAQPEPQTVFWRDAGGRVPVVQGGRFEVTVKEVKGVPDTKVMTLTIKNTQHEDEGEYFCHAENFLGSSTQPVTLKIRPAESLPMNASSCCESLNVNSACLDACSAGAFLDLDSVLDQPECVNDLPKIIRCAADGSDHRSCCTQRGLPQSCLNWCRGETMDISTSTSASAPNNHKFCLLVYGQHIMACFQQGQDRLPGPPQSLKAIMIGANFADISWEPPTRNPDAAQTYRVFWRELGSRLAMKNDSLTTELRLMGLKPATFYECVVKAGNQYGTSMLSKPVRFKTNTEDYITTPSSLAGSRLVGVAWPVGIAVGTALIGVVAVLVVLAAAWLVRTKKVPSNAGGRVAFENPGYLRELHMDNIASAVGDGQVSWRQESLQVATVTGEEGLISELQHRTAQSQHGD